MKEREYGIEERLAGLVQPDTLLPSQYFDRVRRRGQYNGERRLMIAILEDAVDVYLKQAAAHDARGQQLFLEADGASGMAGPRPAALLFLRRPNALESPCAAAIEGRLPALRDAARPTPGRPLPRLRW